jgi:transposase
MVSCIRARVFNDGLRARQTARANGEKYVSDAELSKQIITRAKDTPERAWLGEVSSVVLQQALADLNVAYRNFFASISGKRKGRKVAPPRFRSRKDNRQAIRFTRNARFKVLDNGRLRLPKIGDVDVRWSRDLPAGPSSVTVIRDAAGRYFASFVVQSTGKALPPTDSETGIDLGLTHFAVLSDGTKVAARGWQNPCTTPAGRRSRPCWSTKPLATGAPSPGWTDSSRPPGCAPIAAGSTTRWRSTSGSGSARVAATTTGTSTRP